MTRRLLDPLATLDNAGDTDANRMDYEAGGRVEKAGTGHLRMFQQMLAREDDIENDENQPPSDGDGVDDLSGDDGSRGAPGLRAGRSLRSGGFKQPRAYHNQVSFAEAEDGVDDAQDDTYHGLAGDGTTVRPNAAAVASKRRRRGATTPERKRGSRRPRGQGRGTKEKANAISHRIVGSKKP